MLQQALPRRRLGLAAVGIPADVLRRLGRLVYANCDVSRFESVDFFKGLSNLRELVIVLNNLTHELPGNPNRPEGTLISQIDPAVWRHLPNLRKLKIGSNRILTLPRGFFRHLTKLEELDMYDMWYEYTRTDSAPSHCRAACGMAHGGQQAGYVRDHAFDVTNGEVLRAQRQEPGRNRRWTITVEPVSHSDVVISLPGGRACGTTGAICTGDGRKLSNGNSATVAGPVGLSVSDARVEENEGAELSFTVTLSRAASGAVNGGVHDRGRHCDGRRRLHGDERDADLLGRRHVEDGRGLGARRLSRRGRGDARTEAVERLGRPSE